MLLLKDYQRDALNVLAEYLKLASESDDPDTAFYAVTRKYSADGKGTAYEPVEQLRGVPYVCVKIPTGGGKTFVASHAVGIATRELQRQDRSLVLWLVPTNTIKDQTLAALRKRHHPYRQAVETSTSGPVTVMDLTEALYMQRPTLDADTVIIVSTMAALRVEDKDGRKVYEDNGNLMSHFEDLPAAVTHGLEKFDNGNPVYSLANVFRLRSPIIIVDEAHNARTDLSFDTLARFGPSCIIEFTATPREKPKYRYPSNLLFQVTAYDLKSEHMIKLPIILETDPNWEHTLSAAITRRSELEALANNEEDYLRPIALIQAQPRSQHGDTLTVEKVKDCLLSLNVPADWIAVETGQMNEVGDWEKANGATLFDESCPIRFIITVDKLKEGWDCPFAYVLCSVRDLSSRTAVEQVLGRVLRLPNATEKKNLDLNKAYAFVSSLRLEQTLETLTSGLIDNGFTRFEARSSVEMPTLPLDDLGGLFSVASRERSPAARGERFDVPQLALWVDGDLEPFEEWCFLDREWLLRDCDAALNEIEFPSNPREPDQVEVDITEQGHTSVARTEPRRISEIQQQLSALMPRGVRSEDELIMWLDRTIPHPDIIQPQSIAFLMRAIRYLLTERNLPLTRLLDGRAQLRAAIAKKIDQHRKAAAKEGWQAILFGTGQTQLEVSPERLFTYPHTDYAPSEIYEGRYSFPKHYYGVVGKMNHEEERCAFLIDTLPRVKYWVRNLERKPESSFWLQTSTDKFYPDFVALLEDGRLLAAEYKGSHLSTGDDADEKRRLGSLWEEKSNGCCKFLWLTAEDYEQKLRAVLS
ncbi:MAG: DEAD/DEAH box helicase family protein [Armatimonadetes bacterium]|nr:DEAD/DEAH box helicase family protein [Armatimonadota bacterium]